MENTNKNIYIMSLEGAQIWEHMNREKFIEKKYVGMLPTSLLLDELFVKSLKTFDSKRYNKTMTADVINVKFNQKVRSGKEIIKSIETKYKDVDENDDDALKEKYNELDDIKSEGFSKLKHYKIKVETMYSIIYSAFNGDIECKYKTELLNALYESDNNTFLEVFKKSK